MVGRHCGEDTVVIREGMVAGTEGWLAMVHTNQSERAENGGCMLNSLLHLHIPIPAQ